MHSTGYCLSLSDGCNWWITSDDDSRPILSQLANIMNLKECMSDGFYRLIICEYGSERYKEFMSIDESGKLINQSEWKIYKLKYSRVLHNNSSNTIIFENQKKLDKITRYLNMWLSLHPIYLHSMMLGGLPFHAGLAELDGKAVLFAARGGTGKSTCCRRLPNDWKVLCDDEALAVMGKSGEYMVHPFPTWSDYFMDREKKTWDVQYSAPLSAIFFIDQAEKDDVIPISLGRSVMAITDSSYQVLNKFEVGMIEQEKIELRSEIFRKAHDMAKKIPCYRLQVSLDGSFWEEIEKIIKT